jgi:hypothetical protein
MPVVGERASTLETTVGFLGATFANFCQSGVPGRFFHPFMFDKMELILRNDEPCEIRIGNDGTSTLAVRFTKDRELLFFDAGKTIYLEVLKCAVNALNLVACGDIPLMYAEGAPFSDIYNVRIVWTPSINPSYTSSVNRADLRTVAILVKAGLTHMNPNDVRKLRVHFLRRKPTLQSLMLFHSRVIKKGLSCQCQTCQMFSREIEVCSFFHDAKLNENDQQLMRTHFADLEMKRIDLEAYWISHVLGHKECTCPACQDLLIDRKIAVRPLTCTFCGGKIHSAAVKKLMVKAQEALAKAGLGDMSSGGVCCSCWGKLGFCDDPEALAVEREMNKKYPNKIPQIRMHAPRRPVQKRPRRQRARR